ncbi:MAG: hypothetical protein H6636_09945 [Anaerolineales bacterium]|nr:hypothetical protein [Anaerolineales bacterium]
MNDKIFLPRLLLKTLILLLAINFLFAFIPPAALGHLTLYNTLYPGRPRLPYGDQPALSYNVSLFNLDAMFASHKIAGTPKPADEYRVILIGDSSVWGFLLTPDQTLDAYLNAEHLTTRDGKTVRAYNLGYPTLSLTKDLLILQHALAYEPDLIIWLTTLEALPYEKQLASPLVENNPDALLALSPFLPSTFSSSFPPSTSFLSRTLLAQRRPLADLLRLQLYGVLWSATGLDQYYPETYDLRAEDLEPDDTFYNLSNPLTPNDLAFDILHAGAQLAGDIPLLIVNEPMFVSTGENSDIRYNFYYPRWAYDQYRALLAADMAQRGSLYLDLWNTIPNTEFTNTAIHLTPTGSQQLAQKLRDILNP